METMDSIFNKLMKATDSARGNVMAFGGQDKIEMNIKEALGLCSECGRQVHFQEIENNCGICAKCTQKEIE